MRDRDIRAALHAHLDDVHASDGSNTKIIDELALGRGRARMDVAVVNGALCGYEIKSAHDTFARLADQQVMYDRTFDRVTIVVPESRVTSVAKLVPG